MARLFTATLVLSAALLFAVQPLFGKLVLPLLGGAPSVWATCLVFFQFNLLAGYLYAHVLATRVAQVRQVAIQAVVLGSSLAVLPFGIAEGWEPPAAGGQVVWLLGLLASTVGLPFFAVSTTAPLLQRWFSRTHHPGAEDPYFLYAASNAGSLIGLLGYPIVVEPWLTRGGQALGWAAGYALLVVLVLACAVTFRRDADREPPERASDPAEAREETPSSADRGWWFVLSAVPASLLLGVTTYVSTDLGSFPWLWVAPLSLYLITFINAFARRSLVTSRQASALLPLVALPAVWSFLLGDGRIVTLWFGVHLLAFVVACAVAHGRLADARPRSRWLTEFFVWVSAGGVAGGLVSGLLAPAVLNGAFEYPAALTAAMFLRCDFRAGDLWGPRRATPVSEPSWPGWGGIGWMVPLGLGPVIVLLRKVAPLVVGPGMVSSALVHGLPLLACALFAPRRARFGLGVASIVAVGMLMPSRSGSVLYADRSFFGVVRVVEDPLAGVRRLVHGTTVHGAQYMDPARQREPTSYYHRAGPLGQVFGTATGRAASARVGVIGLGTGGTACHGHPEQPWTFFEIDAAILHVARDAGLFSYLRDCRPLAHVIVGDGRRSLEREADGRYDILVLDAFGSDAIPVHLITVDAVRLYVSKIARGGMLVVHISNRYVDLEPILGRIGERLALSVVCRTDSPPAADGGRLASTWCVLGGDRDSLDTALPSSDWRPATLGDVLWTDDYAPVLTALKRWEWP